VAGATDGGRYEPLTMGSTWTYDVTDVVGGVPLKSTKNVTVEDLEAVPGKTNVMAWRVHTELVGVQLQETWQENQAETAVRHRDDTNDLDGGNLNSSLYAPYKLRVDESAAHTVTGATYPEQWSEVYTDNTTHMTSTKMHSTTWTVVNGAESLTVPAGTFSTLHLQKTGSGTTPSMKEYWFARGVGKVKETSGSGHVEELRSFTIR
jgi:hypothetical protein